MSSFNMNPSSMEVFIFGDQSTRLTPLLQDLLVKGNSPYLTHFVEQVYALFKKEISSLPIPQRMLFPTFANIQELVSKSDLDGVNPALASALACFYHLASFIHLYDGHGRAFPTENDRIIGLCVGSLAAAAVSCSRTLSELVSASVDAVRVALHVGLRVLRTASLFNTSDTPSATWSVIVPEIVLPRSSAQDRLDSFISESGLARSSVPYISSVAHHNLTISGPPCVLEQFVRTIASSSKDTLPVPIHAPYHASHLYSQDDIDEILELSAPTFISKQTIPIISSCSGEVLESLDYTELLRHCINDILINRMDLTKVSQAVHHLLINNSSAVSILLRPVATSVSNSILSSMEPSLAERCVVDSSMSSSASSTHSPSAKDQPEALSKSSKIAIVSISGRFPDAANLGDFWDLLYKGRDVHRQIPEDRFNAELHYDNTGRRKNTSKVMNGCFIKEPGLFDAKFFNISPKEAEQSDPGQRMALETAYEALEMAGIVPDRTPSTQRDRVGVFYGMTSDDWREVNSGQNVDTYFIPGGNRAFTPGRLNYFFKFSGPSASVDTACSSSLAAIHLACNALWRNDCDTAIAGGTNVMTNPDNFAGLDRGHFLSRTGNCNTFDDAADGYCRADGVGTIILKRLEDAEADNDPILGVILGAYTNHSAEAVSITRPHAGAQEYIFSKLLRESGVDPYDVSYIEMHGTGTQAGDATEMSSVLKAFAPTSGSGGRLPHQSLHLGSVKANVGHGESASGVVALIKTLLMMQNNMIPPHCGIKTKINHHFPTDLVQRNVHIAGTPTPWTRSAEGSAGRTAFVNNFSAAGGNSAVLLQDAPLHTKSTDCVDPRSSHVVTVSARSVESLRGNLVNIREFVQGQDGSQTDLLSKLSYTTSARRMHHQFRASVTAQNLEQLSMGLEAAIGRQDVKRVPAAPRSVGFVFSGQGAQYSGMGKDYFEHFTVFRSEIMSYNSIARSQGFPSILPLIRGEIKVESLSPVESQLGLACLQMALAKLWKSFGIEPSFVFGHSLGHYAALHIAGVLSATDTIYLTGTRAQLLTDKCQAGSHSMLAVRASLLQIQQFLDANIHEVACVNGPREVVISGKVADIDQLADILSADNIKATRIKLPFAFHSAQVDPILFDLDTVASRVTFHSPQIPVLCALDSSVINPGNHGAIGPLHLQRHCRETVNFEGALHAAEREKIINRNSTLWIEIGPHVVCSAFLKASLGQDTPTIASLRRNDDCWKVLADGLSTLYNAGLPVDWDEYHRDFKASHQVLRLPSYSWDHKNYWIQYKYDWSLTKGDPPAAANANPSTEAASTLSTPSVQKILQEILHDDVLTIVAESDLSNPLLNEVAHGHRVNGVKVCTSSVYADVGLTLGKYILGKYRIDLEGYAVDVHGIEVHKPLLLKQSMDGTSQKTPFRIEVRYPIGSTTASMNISSTGPNGQHIEHLDCELRLEHPSSWEAEWDRQTYLIKRSIDYLQERAAQGLDSMLSSGMIYKVFSSLVDYHDGFKGLREVILHSQELEGTAKVRFQTPRGGFVCNPMWIDSCGQTTGFLMNCHQTTPNDYVYVNHGWKSMRLAKAFRQDVVYRTYIRMRPVDGTKFAGDLYILDEGETIVGVYGDITFQGLPRRVLNTVLPPTNSVPVEAPRGRRDLPPPMLNAPATRFGERPPPPPVSAGPGPVFSLPQPAVPSMDSQLRPLLRILSEEIGLSLDILSDDELDFADHGVDSLLSLTITGRMREELGLDIDSSAFLTCPTLGSFKKFLGLGEQDSKESYSTEGSDTSTPSPGIESGVTTPPADDEEQEKAGNSPNHSHLLHQFRATSTLLQGSPSKVRSTLFLLPDGSGSATSYASLPPISSDGDVVVYGLNCPWLKDASYLVQFGLKGLTELYVNEILRRDPHGPYNLGGWSAGGICAYEAALILTRGGYTVQRLILLDSPNPVGLEKLPPRLYDFLDSQNVFGSDNPHSATGSGSAKAPEWLLAHFLAFIDALDAYIAVPWDAGLLAGDGLVLPLPVSPQTYLLWAEDGVCKNMDDARPEYRDDDPREMRWLLENRSNFGPNGWDVLLNGNEQLFVDRISGANHFTMLKRGQNAKYVSAFLAQALGI